MANQINENQYRRNDDEKLTVASDGRDYGNIIDPDRDTGELVAKKIAPNTIKALLGEMDENSPEYKRIMVEYRASIVNQDKKGVIYSKDKQDERWAKTKARSYYIDKDVYRNVGAASNFQGIKNVGKRSQKVLQDRKFGLNQIKFQAEDQSVPSVDDALRFQDHHENNNDMVAKNIIKVSNEADGSIPVAQSVDKAFDYKIDAIKSRVEQSQSVPNAQVAAAVKKAEKSTAVSKQASLLMSETEASLLTNWNMSLDFNDSSKKHGAKQQPTKTLSSIDTYAYRFDEEPETITRQPVCYREHEEIGVKRALRPRIAQQVSELRRHNLSLVDFIIKPEEDIDVKESAEEVLVRLISRLPYEVGFDDFAESAPRPVKFKPVVVMRENQNVLSPIERFKLHTLAKKQELELNRKSRNDAASKRQVAQEQNSEETAQQRWEAEQLEIARNQRKNINYNYQFDQAKRPDVLNRRSNEQRFLIYLESLREQYESGHNRQISQDLGDFNRAINLTNTVKSTNVELQAKIDSNRESSMKMLKEHVELLNQKQRLELKLLKIQDEAEQVQPRMEEFIKNQNEFHELLLLNDKIKISSATLINSLREQAMLIDQARKQMTATKSGVKTSKNIKKPA